MSECLGRIRYLLVTRVFVCETVASQAVRTDEKDSHRNAVMQAVAGLSKHTARELLPGMMSAFKLFDLDKNGTSPGA